MKWSQDGTSFTATVNGLVLRVWRCGIANNGRSGWAWSVDDGEVNYCRTLKQAKRAAAEARGSMTHLGTVTAEEFRILNMVSARHSISMVDVEKRPPFGLTPERGRELVQKLYDRGVLVLNSDMRFELP